MKTLPIPTLFRFSALAVALALATPAVAHAAQDARNPAAAQHRDERDADARHAHPAQQAAERAREARDAAQARQAQQREAIERQQAARSQEHERALEQARAQQRQAVAQQRAQAERREALQRAEAQRRDAKQQADAQHRAAVDQRRAEAQREDAQRRLADQRRTEMQHQAAARQQEAAQHARQRAEAQQRQRVSDAERRQRIADQQRRLAEYRTLLARHEALERAQYRDLQQARRMQAWRYQQAYWAGQRSMQARWATRGYNYTNDPYYWTPASYRYVRSGRSYLVNQYAADLLRQAVRYGYDQGVRAGEADRLDRWGGGYRNNFAFQDALYGYNGYYVSPDDYSYYFRQGFERGYQDGYNRAWQYGRYDNGNYDLLSSVLQLILNLQPLG